MRSHVILLMALSCFPPLVVAERGDLKKSPREVDLRVALFDDDSALIVYDAEPPPALPREDSGGLTSAQQPYAKAYVAYWMSYPTGELSIFGRRLHDPLDVGHALRNLRRDLGSDPSGLLELDPELARALSLAETEPDNATLWHSANDGILDELLHPSGSDDSNGDTVDESGIGSVADTGDGVSPDSDASSCPPETMGTGPRRFIPGAPKRSMSRDDIQRAVLHIVGCGGACPRCIFVGVPIADQPPCDTQCCDLPNVACPVLETCCDYTCCRKDENLVEFCCEDGHSHCCPVGKSCCGTAECYDQATEACCSDGHTCPNPPCEECAWYGSISDDGLIVVQNTPVCLGEPLVFELQGANDLRGAKRVNCNVFQWDGPVETTVDWDITKPDGSHVPGKGRVATILADQPGTYWCEFHVSIPVSADRECPPPPIDVGPAIAWTPTDYATVEIRYKAFIACNAFETARNLFLYDYYKGDNRSFGYDAGMTCGLIESSRTIQSYLITLDPNAVSPKVGTPLETLCSSAGYDNEGNTNDIDPCSTALCPSFCQFCVSQVATAECSKTAILGVGGNVLRLDATSIPPDTVFASLKVVAYNPCVTGVINPAINVDVSMEFRQRCNDGILLQPEYRVLSGQHDGFPWHELYLNGAAVYSYDPCAPPNVPSPSALFGNGDIQILQQNADLADWRPVP